jgi:hypothetical protein
MTRFFISAPIAALAALCGVMSCSQLPQGDLVGTNTIHLTNYSTNTIVTKVTNVSVLSNTNTVTNATVLTNSLYFTNIDTITRITNITGYLVITNTNDSESAVNIGDYSNFLGVWMVTTNTYLGTVDSVDGNGFVTETSAILTNTSFSLDNGGTNGTMVYRFNPDGTVDMFEYDGNGNIDETNYIYRTFAVYSNTTLTGPDSLYVELTDPTTVSESVYWTPAGTSVAILTTNIYIVSNYSYGATNISNITNFDPFLVTVTNYWVKHDQTSREVDSYIYSLVFNGATTNLNWQPNTITNQSPGRWSSARRKSSGVVNTTTVVDNSGNGSVSTITTFLQQAWDTWTMVKITNTYQ